MSPLKYFNYDHISSFQKTTESENVSIFIVRASVSICLILQQMSRVALFLTDYNTANTQLEDIHITGLQKTMGVKEGL